MDNNQFFNILNDVELASQHLDKAKNHRFSVGGWPNENDIQHIENSLSETHDCLERILDVLKSLARA